MLGKAVPVGGLAWQDVHAVWVSGDPAWWQAVQRGARLGEVPVTAWQMAQLASKLAWVAPVCWVARKGMVWLGWPGPLKWQATPLFTEEKQLGEAGMGAVRPLV